MKTNLIDNRQIRVFISSTFQDMQGERDYLMKYTFPILRNLASKRDVTLTELDLRWGITEEESKSGKVVEICLREIENSIPFFIGIIGNRYGWVPEKKDIHENVTDRFKDVSNYLERHLSVTEMEIQFGVLQRKEDMHAYFYIKEGEEKEEPDNPEMLERIKKEVMSSRYPSSTYSSPEDLGVQVEQAFTTLLNQLFPEGNLSELEKERIGQRSFMRQLCLNYIRDDKNFQVLDKWMNDWERHQLVVTGASGLGKSALIANWLNEKLSDEHRDYNIIYHFTGNGGSESSHEHILRVLIEEINDVYGWEADDEMNKQQKDVLNDLFIKVASEGKKPLLIVLDAINQIVDTDNAKLLNWLPIPPKDIKILFSTLEDDRTMEVFNNHHYPVFVLQPISLEQRQQLVTEYLEKFGKKLTDIQIERITTDKQSENTLVLKTLLDELINFGVYERLDERIDYYLSQDTIEDFYQALLLRFEKDFGKRYVCKILSLLYTSQYGITEDELLIITKARKYLKWSQFYCSFINHFVLKNGRISFSHEYIRKAVIKRYIRGNYKLEKECRHDILLNKLRKRKNAATISITIADLLEIPYQLYMLKNDKLLFKELGDLPTIAIVYNYERPNIIRYWERLLSKGYSMDVYKTAEDKLVGIQEKDAHMMWEVVSFFKEFGRHDICCELEENRLQELMVNEETSPDIKAMALNDLANTYYALDISNGENDEYFHKAFDCFEKATDIAKETNNYQELIVSYNGLANLWQRANNFEEMINCSKRALELSRNHCKIEVPICLLNLSRAYGAMEEYDKSILYVMEYLAITIERESLSERAAIGYYILAYCYCGKGQYHDALNAITDAIRILNGIYENYYDMDDYIELRNQIKQHIADSL